MKFNKEQIEVLKGFWKDVKVARNRYFDTIGFIEEQLSHALEIDDIEIFHVDGAPVGIGDYYRQYELVQGEDL